MMGRAGRPQYDQHGKAVILVHEPKKSFYKKVTVFPSLLMDDKASFILSLTVNNIIFSSSMNRFLWKVI